MTGNTGPRAREDVQRRVRDVARCARSLVYLYGVSCFLATVVLALLALGFMDYLVRFQDVGMRVICFALLWLVVAWGSYRYLRSAWLYRCSDLQAAQRIERRFPSLGDLLSSAVAFSAQGAADQSAGSLELRRTVIAQAEIATQPLDFTACLDRRQTLRALAVAAVALTGLLFVALVNSPATTLAAKRLFVPWGDDHWPRRHVLQFTAAPARLASGHDFEVELVDAHGRLPDQVRIHYWFDGEEHAAMETHVMQPLGEKLTHRLNNVTRSFRYRATGGDDQSMPWRELQVVEPARVVSQELLLMPPDYSGLAARPATGSFRALRGTRVALHVRVSKRLKSAALETDTTSDQQSIRLKLDADRLGCTLAANTEPGWVVVASGSYGFRLVDTDDVDGGTQERWEVEAIADAPPAVSLKQPTADLFLTPGAKLSVEAIVKDDLAIRSVALEYSIASQQTDEPPRLALWTGPDRVTAESDNVARRENEGVQRTVPYDWDLSALPGLEPGTEIEFRVVASDYQPQEGPSPDRRITIISAEEHEERIVQRQAEILAQIAEVARLQRQTREQTTQLGIPLREIGALDRDDVDQLQGAELNQRQVQQRLGHPSDGIEMQIAELIRDVISNGLDGSATLDRLGQLRDGIHALNDDALPGIEHHMIDALKLAREGLEAGAAPHREPLQQLLNDVTAGQEQVVRALEEMLGQLSQWDSYRRLATEVGRFRREQTEVRQRTESLRQETISKDLRDLTDAQRVELYRLAEQQNDVALRFDALEGRMNATRQQLTEEDPQAAASLNDAMTLSRRAGISGDMRDAAHQMEGNRLSQATQQQDEVIQWLGELQDVLAHRRKDTQQAERHERLGRLYEAVTPLLERQRGLAAETLQAEQTADAAQRSDAIRRLAEPQIAIGQDLQTLQQTVADIQSFALALGDAGAAAARAAQSMQQNASDDTRRFQQEVIDTLTRLLDALRDEQPPPRGPDESPPDPTTSPQDQQPKDNEYLLVQLRLIRAMQEELNKLTAMLDQASQDAAGWTEQRVEQQQELTARQGSLADLVHQLLGPDAEPAATPDATRPQDQMEQLERALDGETKSPDQMLLEGLPGAQPQNPAPETKPQAADGSGIVAPFAAGSDVSSQDPLERVGQQMRVVQQRLAQRDVAEPTQTQQRQIVTELGQLIDALAARKPGQTQQAKTERKPGDGGEKKTGQESAKDATGGSQQAVPAETNMEAVQHALGEVWGHLPERYRRHVQNAATIEFLPQYRTLIEDYYRRLSEER